MSRNNKNSISKKELNENDLMDIILNKDSEDFKNIQFHSIKATNMKKIKFFRNNVEMNENEIEEFVPFNRLKRSNSVDIYKKRKEKKLKNNQENNDNIIIENDKSEFKNGKKIKRVTFLKPKFVTIIDVESYKKFNMENTSKDPIEYLLNNNNINANNNNKINDNNKNENDKERVVCSCYIF